MSRYQVSELAEADLFDVWRFLAVESSVETAERQNRRFHSQFLTLAANPYIGRARPELRGWPVGNYIILYQPVDDDGVEIVRVLRGSRDIEALF